MAATDADAPFRTPEKSLRSAEVQGFDVHAGITVRGRSRGTRAAVSLRRPPGREPRTLVAPRRRARRVSVEEVAAQLRDAPRDGAVAAHGQARRVGTPPRFPLLRFAGMLAPKSSWRAGVVPRSHAEAPRPVNDAPGTPAKQGGKKSRTVQRFSRRCRRRRRLVRRRASMRASCGRCSRASTERHCSAASTSKRSSRVLGDGDAR
jgi:hypothetical protein